MYLSFDAVKNGRFRDLSGNGNDGIPHGAVLCRGVNGKGIYVGGWGECVSIAVSESLEDSEAFSLEVWVAPDKDKIDGLITTGDFNAGEEAFGLYTVYGRVDLTYTRADGRRVRLRTRKPYVNLFTLPERSWTHIVGTYDGLRGRIYVNGELVEEGKKEERQKRISLKNPILIGKMYGSPWWALMGAIDEVRVFNRALSDDEVKASYECRRRFKPAPAEGKVAGTIDRLPYRDARARLRFSTPPWIHQLPVKGAGWLNFSNTGDFFLMLTGGKRMRYDLFRFGLLDQRQRREKFWTEVEGSFRLRRLSDGRDYEGRIIVEGKTYHRLAVKESVELTPEGEVKVRYEVRALDEKAPVPYVPLRFNLPSARAIRFVGFDPRGAITGNMPDLGRIVHFRKAVEWSFLDLRLRMWFGEGVEYELKGERSALRWLGGYSGFYGRVQNYQFEGWGKEKICVVDFSFMCKQSSEPPLLDYGTARKITREKPFDFSPLYAPDKDAVRLEPVGRDVPIFGEEEVVRLQAFFPKRMRMTRIVYTVKDAYSGRTVLSASDELSRDWWFAQPQILFRAPKPGVYLVHLKALGMSGEVLGEATHEAVVAGRIPQPVMKPGEKLRLKLVDSVDCTRAGTHKFFSYSGASRVLSKDGVRYRTTLTYRESLSRGEHNDWFGYRLRLKHPEKVHLVEVIYPELDGMNMAVNVLEPKDETAEGRVTAVARVLSGIWTGEDFPSDGKLKSFSTIYFPSADWCVVVCENLHGTRMKDAPGASVARINLYELEGELPKLGLDRSTDRLLGIFTEDGTLVLGSFGRGVLRGESFSMLQPKRENFYREYYRAVADLIRYLRYRGDSVYVFGVYRYRSAQFPSRLFPPTGHATNGDLVALMAKMFEYNGLKLILCVEATPLISVIKKEEYANTLSDVRRGAPTLMQISPDGEFIHGAWGGYLPNPFHPVVQAEYTRLAGELAERYGKYPAVAGIAWLVGFDDITTPSLVYPPAWRRKDVPVQLASTFDDMTIRQFEQFLGRKLPGEPGDPTRFRKRFDWMLKNAKEEWIEFRCRKIAEMYERMKDAVRSKSSSMDFFVVADWVRVFSEPELTSPLDLLRLYSFDPSAYRGKAGLVYCLVMPTNAMIYFDRGYIKSRKLLPNVDKWVNDDGLFRACESIRSGRFLHRQFFENRVILPRDRRWVFKHGQSSSEPSKLVHNSYPQPGGRHNLRDFALIMARGTPSFICWMWCDGGMPMGHEESFREFAYAYRQLPLGHYRLLQNENTVFIRALTDAPEGQACFYAVNTGPENIKLELKNLPGGMRFRDVAASETLSVSAGRSIELEPYQLRVFVEVPPRPGD